VTRQAAEHDVESTTAHISSSSESIVNMINKQHTEDAAIADDVLAASSEAGQKLQGT
jgi:hypothetical protein